MVVSKNVVLKCKPENPWRPIPIIEVPELSSQKEMEDVEMDLHLLDNDAEYMARAISSFRTPIMEADQPMVGILETGHTSKNCFSISSCT